MTERTPTTDSNDLAHQSGTSRRSGGPVDSLILRFTGLCHRTTKNHSTKPPSDTTSASLRRPTWPTPDRKPPSPGPSFLTHAEEKEKYRNRPPKKPCCTGCHCTCKHSTEPSPTKVPPSTTSAAAQQSETDPDAINPC